MARGRTDDGGRGTEDGGWGTEDGGRRTDDGGWSREDEGRRTEDGRLRIAAGLRGAPDAAIVCLLSSVLSFFFLLDHFAEEREDKEREDRAPDEGVEDHQHPPEDSFGGGAESVGDGVARLAEETALEDQEQDEVDDAERDVCE